jgi:Zn-dependent protease
MTLTASAGELREIALAIGILTLAFAFLISPFPYGPITLVHFGVAFIAVLTAFFLHEMAHKYVAFKYGYPAAFKAWKTGLLIAVISSFMGFLFATPGAVYIYGYPSKEENGKISLAGPLTNIVAGFVFLLITWIITQATANLLAYVLLYIANLNFFLALFNTLPIGPMDGLKIMRWNIGAFIILLLLSITGLVATYWILPP